VRAILSAMLEHGGVDTLTVIEFVDKMKALELITQV